MTKKISIAVIVSTYESPETLVRVLDGYLHQTQPPDELIVADDGSGEPTKNVVLRFNQAATFPIKRAWHEHQGYRLAKVRNEAVNITESDYIVFTDGDCIPHPTFVADHIRLAQDGYFVQGKRMLVGERISPIFTYPGAAVLARLCICGQVTGTHHLLRVPSLSKRVHGLRGIKTANFGLFREDFVAVNGFNEDFVGWGREDTELVARLFRYGLMRKDALFSAIVFHLWHPQVKRTSLIKNDQILQRTLESSDYICRNGLVKKGE